MKRQQEFRYGVYTFRQFVLHMTSETTVDVQMRWGWTDGTVTIAVLIAKHGLTYVLDTYARERWMRNITPAQARQKYATWQKNANNDHLTNVYSTMSTTNGVPHVND